MNRLAAERSRTYKLHGLALTIHTDEEILHTAVGRLLGLLRAHPATGGAAGGLTLRFARTLGAVPPDAVLVDTHERGVEVLSARTGRKTAEPLYLRLDDSTVELAPAQGTATFRLASEIYDEEGVPHPGPLFDLLILSLLILFQPRGLYLLHAACLVHEEAGVLLSAHSRSGKSTLATGLVCAGWRFLSDDILLLHEQPAGVEALGLGTQFRLLPDTLRRFPGLAARPDAAPFVVEKHHLDVDVLFPGRYTPRCLPRVLVIPELADRPDSELQPLPASKALLHLLGQTTLLLRDRHLARRHLATLKRLASQVQPYRLQAGRDLYDDPAKVATLLTPLLKHL
ncbi:hypothetical protein GQ464_004515 [Rhodocaloribacter litoris]|uniref:hypothetical protein n=1 Tax=Rhodocaloribacter litoris TaxID=2558931 RepID=UPI001424287D|nr:hypothetical protein [Rhodocaloribacter litoris]QXD16223.1 hypothetical protein GQ464_004515 [Rhodocaloribacter litoris]